MIEFKIGNIFDSDCNTLVNPVNCVGVMGAGLAKQFKERYPIMFEGYVLQCKNDFVPSLKHGGDLWLWRSNSLYDHKNVLNFATKEDWKDRSEIDWIEIGLQTFVKMYKYWGIDSIAWPKLGCANGKLNWETQVRPLMYKYLAPLDDIKCEIYE